MSIKFVTTEEFNNMICNDYEMQVLYKNHQYSKDSKFADWLKAKDLWKIRWFNYREDYYIEKRGDYLDRSPYDQVKDYQP